MLNRLSVACISTLPPPPLQIDAPLLHVAASCIVAFTTSLGPCLRHQSARAILRCMRLVESAGDHEQGFVMVHDDDHVVVCLMNVKVDEWIIVKVDDGAEI